MVYSIPDFKMASNSNTWNMEQFARGRASALIDAVVYYENRRDRNRGRAGRTPLNFDRIC